MRSLIICQLDLQFIAVGLCDLNTTQCHHFLLELERVTVCLYIYIGGETGGRGKYY